MSIFKRIDPNHPLTEAARYVSAYADEHGLAGTLDWLGMDASPEEVAYLAEQRAIRVVYALRGINLNLTEETPVELSAEDRKLIDALVPAYMDGFAIGWKAHELSEGAEQK